MCTKLRKIYQLFPSTFTFLQTFYFGFFCIRLKNKIQKHLRLRSPGTVVSWMFLSPKSLKSDSDLEKVLYYDTDDLHNAEKGNGIVYHKQQAHTDNMADVICQVSRLYIVDTLLSVTSFTKG